MITPGRLWWLLKRDVQRGWTATKHHYRTVPKLDSWHWPFRQEAPHPVEVHVLTGRDDWRLCAWMLATWFTATENTWRVVVHDDGSLPPEGRQRLESMFPHVRTISRSEADTTMRPILADYVECTGYRAQHPLGLKIFDVPHFAVGDRFLLLDSDLVFFAYPREIMDWVQSGDGSCWFNEDVAEGALISPEVAERQLGVKLWSRVNTGLCLIDKAAVDFSYCERALKETPILEGHVWRVEQTLYALCASRYGKGGLLPGTYEVSLGQWASPEAVMRHYVGAVRQRFYGEGIERVYREILSKD